MIDLLSSIGPASSDRGVSLSLSRVGWAGTCDRRLAYAHHGIAGEARDSVSMRKPDLGWAIEDRVIRWIEETTGRVVRDRQRRVEWHGLCGHVDGTLDGCLLEIKSMGRYQYKRWRELGLDGDVFLSTYRGQVQSYLAGLDLEVAYVVGVDRESAGVHVVREDRDDQFLARLAERVDAVRASPGPESVSRGSDLRQDSLPCRYCEWAERCWGR